MKKNCSVEELNNYLIKIQCIIETTCVYSFIMDSIYTSLNFIEPLSKKTKYDISGLCILLKTNKQFKI